MKKTLLFFLFFSHLLSYAQLDREHWFPPMVDKVNSYGISYPTYQSIYMSTGETTPFKVDVYFNNAVVATLTISKNNPQKYTIDEADRERIIINPLWTANPAAGLFQPVNMGFYLKGEKPFFASLRFSVRNHGEIQTSKGTAALGKEFRAVVAPLTNATGRQNFMNSIMATENNTKVTVSDYQPDVVFTDEIPRSEITFVLDKGQSYIIEGPDSEYGNQTGYIGAKIVSDKPIVVANGNFNGQYAAIANDASSDILMDQTVPINKLGKTFVLVKGNGENSFNLTGEETTMEKAIVVAVKDNTKIYVNGNTTPAAVLNAGQFFETLPNTYINQGSDHYNMFIEATEDVYVYQLLAGLGKSPTETGNFGQATGGFNYIPPLSCYLPKKIDEIGNIDENQYTSNNVTGGSLTVPTKLNIITEKGAVVDVKRNGTSLVLTAANGPFNVTGNSNWITYSIPNISGNIAIFSSKAVTAGISAGNDAVGYGGYFAGFSSIPMITKTEGECLADGPVRLEVIAGFDSYEWYNVDDPTTILSTTHFYYPTEAGIYYVKIQTGSCAGVQTENFHFFNCTDYTNYNYVTCSDQIIIPQFALSTQAVNPSTVTITVPPTKGTVTIDAATGNILYKANKNETGIDTFRFSFCGISSLPDCEVIQATIQLNQVVNNDVELVKCNNNNTSIFNLKNAAVTPDLTAQKKYYYDSTLLNSIPNSLLENFPGTDGDKIYVHLTNTFGCEDTAIITLKIDNPPIVNEALYTKLHCDEDIDGIIDGRYRVNLNTITPIVVPNNAGLNIRYYNDEAEANAGGTNTITGVFIFTNDATPIWIWVKANNICPPVIRKILLRTGSKISINNPVTTFICDNDLNQSVIANLDDYVSLFSTDTNLSVKYYDDLTKAQNNIAGENISTNQTITGDKTFYYRIAKSGSCDNIGTLHLNFRQPKTSTVLTDQKICGEATTTLDAGAGFDGYLWSNGETTQTINDVPVGNYWVDLLFNGCVYRQNVSITAVEVPTIVSIEIKGSVVTVNATGGNPPLRYAMDNFNYQNSNVFTNVPGGPHTVYVISADNCIPVSAEIEVIQLYNVITPNADGINDVLNYSALLKKEEPFIQIFDRYGKTVFIGDANNQYSWNGKTSGRPVNTGSYWYIMKWKEPGFTTFTEYSGWILVKNRD